MLKWKICLKALWIFVFLIFKDDLNVSGITINLPNGQIQGTQNSTRANTTFFSFYALRYAQPPVGELRFQPAVEEVAWNNTYNARSEKNICFQVTSDSNLENEDCLFANVFTPKDLEASNITANLAVMVYIHGGGFVYGNGYQTQWGPKFFMDYGVVLVTFNYRLGPFGFLSSGDNVIPSNVGLKDQVRLLKWVKKNIEYFGGDPRKVTIFGESSGAGSVGYLILSSLARNLYRAAICQSGSGLSPLAYQSNLTNITYSTAAQINSTFADRGKINSTELLHFLKTVSARDLDAASVNVTNILGGALATVLQLTNGMYYAPVLECTHSKDPFITDRMYRLFERGVFNRVPVILGFNGDEALALTYTSGYLENVSRSYDNDPTNLVAENMHISNSSLKKYLGSLIKTFFTDNSTFEESLIHAVNFHSSHNMEKPIIRQAQLQAKYAPVRFYQFRYSGKMGNNEVPFLPGTSNVIHGEELNYLFSRSYNSMIPDNTDLTKFSAEDRAVHKRLMTLWTNFAKHLDPTPGKELVLQDIIWPSLQPEQYSYLDIGKDLTVELGIPKKETYRFWSKLYEKYAKKPYVSF